MLNDAQTPEAAPRRWRRAARSLARLIADPERTQEVFELIDALSDPSDDRSLRAFASDPRGRALLDERPSLLAALSDRQRLRTMTPGSLGHAYARFMDAADLSADGLVEASERDGVGPQDTESDWHGRRLRDSHDLWHVLTGYGRDEAGELALLAFTYGQLPNRGIGLIVLAGAVIGLLHAGFGWPAYLRQAKRRGAAAEALQFAPFERWLQRPLDDVRRDCGITPAEVAHPEGIAVGSRGDDANLVVTS